MNRRQFIRTIVGTPLLTPLLLAAQRAPHNGELYLISDHPQSHLFPLLEVLQDSGGPKQKTFAFQNSHLCQEELTRLLIERGWSKAAHAAESDLTLFFSHLHRKACPSFSLVKNGKIWDIRKRQLNTLWQSMTVSGSLASLLTVASFPGKSSTPKIGHALSLYKDGYPIEQRPLKGSWSRRIPTKRGPLTVRLHEGQAWIAESSCRHKICVSTPPISMAGERIICAPNHVLLEIQGRGIDTVVG